VYKKIIFTILLIQSIAFSFQTVSASFLINEKNQDLPLLYLSKNRIPHNFQSSFLSNIKYTHFNKSKNLVFVSNILFNEEKIRLFEFGIKYTLQSNEIILGMMDEKDYQSLSLNEHIIFANNHEPIQRLTVKSNEYIPFPWGENNKFWKAILFSYDFTHGILDKNYTYLWDDYYWQEAKEIYYNKAPFLHRKQLDFKINVNKSLSLNIGLTHAAMWGGTTVNVTNDTIIEYPNDFDDFYKVFFWKTGTEEYDRNERTGGVIGNHLGSIDLSITKQSKKGKIKYYYQHIFEDGGSFWFDNKFDGLWGINFKNNNSSLLLKEVNIEFLNTKHQSGNIHPDGVDSYFWHDQYPSGWQYKGTSIGSLFINPKQNRSQILFLSSLLKIKKDLNLNLHIGYGNIYHYYGYKGWDEEIDIYFNDYEKKYKSIFLSLKSTLKNNTKIEYNLALENNLKIDYNSGLEKNISSVSNKLINIKITKDFLLN